MALKKRYRFLLGALAIILVCLGLFIWSIYISPPKIKDLSALDIPRKEISSDQYTLGNNWLKKNKYGVWELYVEGTDFERGVAMGHLSKELLNHQEKAFVDGVYQMLPSGFMLHFLKYLVAWQNRHLQDYVPIELQEEIYGMSHFASDNYDYIGPKFQRKLFYHAAHDIGHTVQNMGLVGCSSFSAWGNRTIDGKILTGRNFDFYVGEDFKKNKLLLFIKPEKGYPFASYSWPGMIGVLSGMNTEGLSISLNAGPPEMPSDSKTPVSILAREILQYASNISEAVAIARKKDIFVSESFLISSANDAKSVIIEKSSDTTAVVEAKNDLLLCTNHFQSPVFSEMKSNVKFQKESSTKRRFQRLQSLISDSLQLKPENAVSILRDWGELSNKTIGFGNEESINFMMAHHSIIFQPDSKDLWISVGSSQMHKFVQYNLDQIFNTNGFQSTQIAYSGNEIAPSNWVNKQEYKNFMAFRYLYDEMVKGIKLDKKYQTEDFEQLIKLNPDLYKGYMLAGAYFSENNDCKQALTYLNMALKKVIPWQKEIDEINSLLKGCQ